MVKLLNNEVDVYRDFLLIDTDSGTIIKKNIRTNEKINIMIETHEEAINYINEVLVYR